MPKQPTPEDIALPGVEGQRGVAGYDVSGLAQGLQAYTQGVQQFGHGISTGANELASMEMYQARQKVLLEQHLTNAEAIDYQKSARHNPNITPDEFNQGLDEIQARHAANIPEGPLQDHFNGMTAGVHARVKDAFAEQAYQQKRSDWRAWGLNELDEIRNSTGPDDDPLHTQRMRNFGQSLDEGVSNGYITPVERMTWARTLARGVKEGESDARFNQGPQAAAAEVERLKAIQQRGGLALKGFPPAIASSISSVAARYGIDPATLGRSVQIESSGNPNSHTGSYKGLLNLSDAEFDKYKTHPGASIWNADDNLAAGAAKMRAEGDQFARNFGHQPSGFDTYMIHQQGLAGYSTHLANPNAPAWQNMAATGEGQQKGEAWAKAAIWGNIPDQYKRGFGNVNNVTSRDFLGMWQQKWSAGRGGGGAVSGGAPGGGAAGAGGGPQEYDDIMPPDRLDAMIRRGEAKVRAYDQDYERAEREREKMQKQTDANTESEYLGDIYGGNPTKTASDVVSDPRLQGNPAVQERIIAHMRSNKDDINNLGRGYSDAYNAIIAPAGTPGKITDPTEILRRAAPDGGDLTPAGANRLLSVMKEARSGIDTAGIHTTKAALLGYAKSKLSFDQEMLMPGFALKDKKGEQIFNAQFVPKFEAAFDKWTKDGKDPMEFLTQKNVDEMMKGMRSASEMRMDRVAATGETLPEDPKAPLPPPPEGIKPEVWTPLVSRPPLTEAGTPFPHRDWATALEMLAKNPTPDTIRLFNESKFGRAGYDGAKLAAQLGQRSEETPAPPSVAAPSPAVATERYRPISEIAAEAANANRGPNRYAPPGPSGSVLPPQY